MHSVQAKGMLEQAGTWKFSSSSLGAAWWVLCFDFHQSTLKPCGNVHQLHTAGALSAAVQYPHVPARRHSCTAAQLRGTAHQGNIADEIPKGVVDCPMTEYLQPVPQDLSSCFLYTLAAYSRAFKQQSSDGDMTVR